MENGSRSQSPTFGLWYDFRQKVPFSQDYESFYRECLDEIVEGEALGFSDVWLSEHHFVDDGYLASPLTVAAGIAGRTTRIGIGTNILLLPMHNPLRVAHQHRRDAVVAAWQRPIRSLRYRVKPCRDCRRLVSKSAEERDSLVRAVVEEFRFLRTVPDGPGDLVLLG